MATTRTVEVRRAALLVGAVASSVLLAACGGGGTNNALGAGAAAPAAAAGQAAGPAAGQAAGQAAPLAAAPAGFPAREVYVEQDEEQANDGPMAKIQQGMKKDQAVAAGLGTDGLPVVSVVGTDNDCFANTATVAPGATWFVLENRAAIVNELYLVKDGEEIIEVEDLMTGQAGAFKYTLTAGSQWIVACEPGQADRQVRFPLTVTG